jgi:hypothetical protein
MSVDDALTYVVSMGVVVPDPPSRQGTRRQRRAEVPHVLPEMRTTYCGLVTEALLGQTVTCAAGSTAAATTAA